MAHAIKALGPPELFLASFRQDGYKPQSIIEYRVFRRVKSTRRSFESRPGNNENNPCLFKPAISCRLTFTRHFFNGSELRAGGAVDGVGTNARCARQLSADKADELSNLP